MGKQKGFGVSGALLLLAIIALVGGASYYVYKNNNDDSKSDSANSSTAQTEVPVQHKALTIKEWEVMIDQPSLTSDLTYVMQNPDKDGVQRLLFTYKGLPELDSQCAPELTDFGTLARFTPSSVINLDNGQSKSVAEIEKDSTISVVLDRYQKVGNNYYYLQTNSFKPYCGSKQAQDFLNNKVYTSNFKSLSDPVIVKSLQPATGQ